jgi:hypothetical protein
MNTQFNRDHAPQFALTKVFFACGTRKQKDGCRCRPGADCISCRQGIARCAALHLDGTKFFAAMGRAGNWPFFQLLTTAGGVPFLPKKGYPAYPFFGMNTPLSASEAWANNGDEKENT